MLSLRVLDGEAVRLTGLYVESGGEIVPADVTIVVKPERKVHFYAPRAVQIGRLGKVDDAELLRAELASRKTMEVHHG